MKKPRQIRRQLHREDPCFHGLRAWVNRIASWFVRVYFRAEYVGENNVPYRGPALIVCNHISYFDIPAVLSPYDRWVYFVAKKELFEKPILGWIMRWWRAIPIDRNEPMLSSVRTIMSHLKTDHLVAIFPEGTRVADPSARAQHQSREGVIHFALKMNVPIVPMALIGDFRFRSGLKIVCDRPFYIKDVAKGEKTKLVNDLMQYLYRLDEWVVRKERPSFVKAESDLLPEQRAVLAQGRGEV